MKQSTMMNLTGTMQMDPGNLYAGEFKTIKGKKYAFKNDGRMISGLHFVKVDKTTPSLTVKDDDDGGTSILKMISLIAQSNTM